MLKVAFAIVVSKYRYQLCSKFCNQMCTIFSTFITLLFFFYYSPANTPISGYSCLSRSSIGLMSPLLYYFANIV